MDLISPKLNNIAIWYCFISYEKLRFFSCLQDEGAVKVFIQLRRPSDGATSEPLPFLFTPDDSGKLAFWLLRALKPNFDALAKILVDMNHPLTQEILALRRSKSPVTNVNIDEMVVAVTQNKHFCHSNVISEDESEDEDEEEEKFSNESTDKDEKDTNESGNHAVSEADLRSTSFEKEKSLQDAIDDLSTVTPDKLSELGLVFSEAEEEPLVNENLYMQTPPFAEEKLLPMVKEEPVVKSEISSGVETYRLHSSLHMAIKNTIKIPERITFASKSNKTLLQLYEPMAPPPRPPTASKPSFEKVISSLNVGNEPLPPLPPKRVKRNSFLNQSLPALPQKESKMALFQKLFSKKKKSKSNRAVDSNKNDDVSHQSYRSLADYPPSNGFSDDYLTEAENYALYTSVAPRATDSEFDENSCYYSPVEAEPVK